MKYEYATTSAKIQEDLAGSSLRYYDMHYYEPDPVSPPGDGWDLKAAARRDDSTTDATVLWFWQRELPSKKAKNPRVLIDDPLMRSVVHKGDTVSVAGKKGKIR